MTQEKSDAKILAVIPGTFNPVTNAHIHLGNIISHLMPAAKIVYVPTKSSFLTSWKHMEQDEILPDAERVSLLEMGLEGTPFTVDPWETTDEASGKTVDTLFHMAEKYGVFPDNLFWVCGSDKLREIHTWYKPHEILGNFHLICVRRNGDDAEGIIRESSFLRVYARRITVLDDDPEFQSVSATAVREAIHNGREDEIRSLLPPNVLDYLIKKHRFHS